MVFAACKDMGGDEAKITMTMRYSRLAPDHLRAAVAVLDGVLTSSESELTKLQRKNQQKSVLRSVGCRPTS